MPSLHHRVSRWFSPGSKDEPKTRAYRSSTLTDVRSLNSTTARTSGSTSVRSAVPNSRQPVARAPTYATKHANVHIPKMATATAILTPPPKPGDMAAPRARGQKVSAEELRDLRELIRYRYTLDVEIWNLRDVKAHDRDYVEEKMRRAVAALEKIKRIVKSIDSLEYFESHSDYQKLQLIKMKIWEDGKRDWTKNPPWPANGSAAMGGSTYDHLYG